MTSSKDLEKGDNVILTLTRLLEAGADPDAVWYSPYGDKEATSGCHALEPGLMYFNPAASDLYIDDTSDYEPDDGDHDGVNWDNADSPQSNVIGTLLHFAVGFRRQKVIPILLRRVLIFKIVIQSSSCVRVNSLLTILSATR